MQVILDSSFPRPGSAPIWGGKKGEFRDWTRMAKERFPFFRLKVAKAQKKQKLRTVGNSSFNLHIQI